MYCGVCGNELAPGETVCKKCGTRVDDELIVENQKMYVPPQREAVKAQRIMEAPKEKISVEANNIVLSAGEKLVKQYRCSSLRVGLGVTSTGHLFVTNKRVLFLGSGPTSRVCKEVKIDKVNGIDCYYGTNFNFGKIIIGIVLCLIGISQIQNEYFDFMRLIGLVFLIAGIAVIVMAIKKAFYLTIMAGDVNGSISVGQGPLSIFGNSALYSLVAEPTPQTDALLNELGALILDIQTLGDDAIAKWKNV